jgi:hypothetical protein
MKHSNIFAYIELSKFAEGLTLDPDRCRTDLLSQHAYFKIIPSKMFSDDLAPEWDDLCSTVTRSGTAYDDEGRVMMNAVKNTIRQMSKMECQEIAERIISLKQKVDNEF